MDCTVAEFCTTDSELSTATNSLNLENPVTAEEFLNFDNDTAAAEELQKTGRMNLFSDMNRATTGEENEECDQEPQEQGASTQLNTPTVPR